MGLADAIGNLVQGLFIDMPMQVENQAYNRNQQTQNKNWNYADSRAANDMMGYFLTHGNLDGYTSSVAGQDYNDVADYLNPFLSLSSLDLSQRAQKFAEDQFKYNQYVTENGTQIKMNDLKKAGLSPLLATGNSASYSPVSMASGSVSMSGKNRPNYIPMAAPSFNIGNFMKDIATIENIRADTKLKEASANTEKIKPEVMLTGVAKDKADINRINEQTKLIKQTINTEVYKGLLTKSQADYYAEQIATLQWNLEMAQKRGVSTIDTTTTAIKMVKEIISSMGIDVNGTTGKVLMGLGAAAGTAVLAYGAGSKFISKSGGKIINGVKNWWKNRKNKDKDVDTILMR